MLFQTVVSEVFLAKVASLLDVASVKAYFRFFCPKMAVESGLAFAKLSDKKDQRFKGLNHRSIWIEGLECGRGEGKRIFEELCQGAGRRSGGIQQMIMLTECFLTNSPVAWTPTVIECGTVIHHSISLLTE